MKFFLLASFLLSFLFLVGLVIYTIMDNIGAPLIFIIPSIVMVVSLLTMFISGD